MSLVCSQSSADNGHKSDEDETHIEIGGTIS